MATTVSVPDSLLFDAMNAREYINAKLLGRSWMPVTQMKKIITGHADAIKKLDRCFWMEIQYLTEHFDGAIQKHLQECLLAVLPEHGQRQSLAKAVVAARTLATSDVAQAQDRALEQELSSCCNLLSDVNEGIGPKGNAFGKMGTFYKRFLKRVEFVCIMNESENDNAHGCKTVLFGGPALQARWMMCEARSAANSEFVQEPVDLKCFRQFRWILTPAQETILQEWEAIALETGRERLANARNQALKDMEEDSAKKKRATTP